MKLQKWVALMIIQMLHHVPIKMRVNGITTFLLHVYQSITFNHFVFVTATLIADALLKSLYSRLGFEVINFFATSPHFEKARKRFNHESEKSEALKIVFSLQCYLTIPRRVTILYNNKMDLNENKDGLKDLNEVPPSDDWLPYEYIDVEVNMKLDKTKG